MYAYLDSTTSLGRPTPYPDLAPPPTPSLTYTITLTSIIKFNNKEENITFYTITITERNNLMESKSTTTTTTTTTPTTPTTTTTKSNKNITHVTCAYCGTQYTLTYTKDLSKYTQHGIIYICPTCTGKNSINMGIGYDNCIDFVTNASVTLNVADLPILTYIIHVFKFTIKYSIVPNVVTTRDLYLII